MNKLFCLHLVHVLVSTIYMYVHVHVHACFHNYPSTCTCKLRQSNVAYKYTPIISSVLSLAL